jgi:protocatechuate 3,4-dioxygenase beta subunit
MAAETSTSGLSASDKPLQALHEEIARLPEKLRRAVILCDLQRVPQDRAAGELRLSGRTLQRRLSEGRKRLKARLIRRGLAPEGGMLGAMFLREARAIVPSDWGEATVRAALATVNHGITVGVVSAAAKELTQEVIKIMLLEKLKSASGALLAAGLIAWVASAALVSLRDEPSKKTVGSPDPPVRRRAKTAVPRPDPNSLDTLTKGLIHGRVLGPDGRPVAGAKLYQTPLMGYLERPYLSPEYATTGPDGRFEFTVSEAKYRDQATVVAAAAPNLGVGWVEVPRDGTRNDLTLQLVDDDVPITGQIIDLEGKPVPGATLRVLQINAARGEDLGPWLEAVNAKKGLSYQLEQKYLSRFTIALSSKVTTDAEGRFRLTGIGRNRLVGAQLDGPTIVSQYLHILTRPGKPIEVTEYEGQPDDGQPRMITTYYGDSFQHVAAPTKPIVGVVRDKDTKKPLAGITIRSHTLATRPKYLVDIVRTTTDAEGHYRLTGMPKGKGNRIMAVPASGQPYVVSAKDVPDSTDLDPVTVDVELKRGILIEGKITDKVTGKPLRGQVEYLALYSNRNLSDYDGFAGSIPFNIVETQEDGSYQVAGLPGPGLVATFHKDHYLRATERDDEYGIKEASLNTAPFALLHPSNYSALGRIDPAKGVDSVKRDVTLDPGWTVTGTVLGMDGKPLAGARRLTGMHWWERDGMKTAEFTIQGFNPRRPPAVLFQHPEKGLIGVAQPPMNKGGSVTVRMKPGASVTGRLVDADGQPRAAVELEVAFRIEARQVQWQSYSPGHIKTDQDGRFRVTALLPGYEFRLSDGKGVLPFGDGTLRSGQAKDLGDVKMKAEEE